MILIFMLYTKYMGKKAVDSGEWRDVEGRGDDE